MKLTKEQLESNKERFLTILSEVKRKGFNFEDLKNWLLNKSDFFTAPASTTYHNNFEGGLCLHSLNVYDTMVKLVEQFYPEADLDGVAIIALLHDISKANYYETYMKNIKVGEDWIQVQNYKLRDAKNRFIYGNHEQNSEFMVKAFADLTLEESCAILHHHGGMGFDSSKVDIGMLYNKFPLALLLHNADMIASFLVESGNAE